METPSTDFLVDLSLFVAKGKNRIWSFGIPSWLFGITDRSVASFADGYLSTIELLQLFTASFLFVTWLYLKPKKSLSSSNVNELKTYWPNSIITNLKCVYIQLEPEC